MGQGDIAQATGRLATAGCAPVDGVWLDEGKAADIFFAMDPVTARAVLTEVGDAIDVIVQPAAIREKALIIADMDSTMITVECIDELADYAGIKPQIAEITERAMRGELDFAGALNERVALLKGLPDSAIDQCRAERVRIMPGAKALVRTMKARGARTLLVSGGFTRFTGPVAEEIGFDANVANVLEIADGALLGTVVTPIVDAARKRRHRSRADAGCGRRRERHSDDRGSGPGRRLSCQAQDTRGRRGRDRPWRPFRAALRAGDRAAGLGR